MRGTSTVSLKLSASLANDEAPLTAIEEFESDYWFGDGFPPPTVRHLAECHDRWNSRSAHARQDDVRRNQDDVRRNTRTKRAMLLA